MATPSDGNPVAVAPPAKSDSTSAITKSWLMSDIAGSSRFRLGNYDIVARLGQGGMGRVYKARHRNLKRNVALKTLRADIDASSETIARFYREMEAIGRINHPNVVTATDAGPLEGIDCLVMEYLEGVDLASLLRKITRLPVAMSCELIRQAAEGMSAITAHGLVHRDIKPSNLFLCRGGQVKILDLGLARLGVDDDFTRRGEVYGTADYIAPEVAMGLGEYGAEADVYSLGCTLYKLLAGRAPFETQQHDSFVSKMHAHASDVPEPVRKHAPEVPAELEALLSRMMAKEPGQRPTASQIAFELAAYVEDDTFDQLLTLAARHALVVEPISGSDASTPLGKSPSHTRPEQQQGRSAVLGVPLRMGVMIVASLVCLLALAPLAMWAGGYRLPALAAQPEQAPPGHAIAEEDPPGRPIAPPSVEIQDSPVEVLTWNGNEDLSFWEIGDDAHSLVLQNSSQGMLAFGSTGPGEHRFSVEVQQLHQKIGYWGVFYGYQRSDRNRYHRFEKICCVYDDTRDQFLLVRSLRRHQRSSADWHLDFIASVDVEIKQNQNILELAWRDHELSEVRLNGKAYPELIQPSDYPPTTEPAKFGVYCSHSAASFYVPRIDGKLLELSKAESNPTTP